MKAKLEYAGLVQGSKSGCGLQGQTDLDRLASVADVVLALDENADFYAARFGRRCWVRIMNDSGGGWAADPIAHARTIAPLMIRLYHAYGVEFFGFINEPIKLEGLGDTAEDYRVLNTWLCQCIGELRSLLAAGNASAIKLWGPALSPGHNEDDNGEYYRLLADALKLFDIIAVHNYWGPAFGFFEHPDFEWWAGRIERAHRLITSMGIVRPFIIAEFNRKVDRGNPDDVARYAAECQRYYQWVNSLDYVVAAFTFLYCNQDPGFDDLTWERMPGMVEAMQQFDRLSEGEWAASAPLLVAKPPESTEGDTNAVVDKDQILASIDTLWGVANDLDAKADALKAEAQRIRDYVVQIKQAAGLDNPKV